MRSELKTYQYTNGEIQKVQVVYLDDFKSLEFVRPEVSKEAIKHIADIYRDFFVKKVPIAFGTMYVFNIPEDIKLPFVSDTERHLEARKWLKKNYKTKEGQRFIRELETSGNLYIVKGKNPFITSFIPYKQIGFLSHIKAKFKVNASFFTFDVFDGDSPYDIYGTPIGLLVKDGKILNPPLFDREAFLVDSKGKTTIRKINVNDLKISIKGKIYQRPECKYTPKSGKKNVIVVGNQVVDINLGRTEVPASGFIVETDEDVKINDEVIYEGLEDIVFGIQVGNSAVINGEKTTTFKNEYYNLFQINGTLYPPSNYPKDFNKDRAPRIVLGEKDGKPVFVWFEGKGKFSYDLGKDSAGASLSEVGDICLDLGLNNAVNLDGGGSAQILVDDKRSLKISDRNIKDNSESERPIPLGIVMK